MKNLSLFFVLSTIFLLFSCSKEEVQTLSPQTQSIDGAKIWFENNPGKNNFSLLEFADKIDWQKAKSFGYADNIIIEVPIVLRQNMSLTADKSKISTNRLLFIKTDNNEYISQIINISSSINNLDFINDLTKINYCNIPTDFTGNVLIIKNDNKSVNLNIIIDGKEKIKKDKTLSKEAAISCYEIVELFDDGSVRHTGIIYCVDGGGGSYGTNYTYQGGGGGVVSIVEIVIVGPSNIITDLGSYLKCFDLGLSATLTIYVDQPTANSSDSWSGSVTDPNVGHTFIAIQQGNIRRVFGYYPRDSVNPYSSPSGPSAFGNNQDHIFDVALAIPINANQLQNVISTSTKATGSTYNLDTFNCTDFGIKIGNLVGLNLPDSYGTWPGGGGSNPGQLGQYIRGMTLPTNAIRQTTSTNSAPNSGECN